MVFVEADVINDKVKLSRWEEFRHESGVGGHGVFTEAERVETILQKLGPFARDVRKCDLNPSPLKKSSVFGGSP